MVLKVLVPGPAAAAAAASSENLLEMQTLFSTAELLNQKLWSRVQNLCATSSLGDSKAHLSLRTICLKNHVPN